MVCFKQLLCLFLKTSYHYISQASLELSTYLPQPSECWHYRLVLECSICCNVFIVAKIPHKACHFRHFDVAPLQSQHGVAIAAAYRQDSLTTAHRTMTH